MHNGKKQIPGNGRGEVLFHHQQYPSLVPTLAVPSLAAIIIDSLNFLHREGRIKIHAWVLMETHRHLVAISQNMSGETRKAKSYTARRIVDCLKKEGPGFLLDQLRFFRKRHKDQQIHQVWQEGIHPKMIMDERMFGKTIEYVDYNPVKRGYIDSPEQWRYSVRVIMRAGRVWLQLISFPNERRSLSVCIPRQSLGTRGKLSKL